ncbi:hypothetical protein A3F55_02175 [Candidatus Adlerbacteria bacterium RIFCSPHIGHO2_12_FULL_53_18]|uniref:AB hydrolase-1 domain-containing protein n=2 Tax=Parcubacteria group TaxID=1794811 RepID=A0A1F4XTJ5_9BACT|nr:MAG: hypothetical protein A3F55_02175 [Candidatus Adlerbacteria bacterium RIFCSPHIGHO2_12_FULL_53_18]OGG51304.1 MAG: hypothetical protein A2704_01730 [Candidatus Kaiserbacteria bacterium RIFCSPHIGHO2_01_FULL_54_36b]
MEKNLKIKTPDKHTIYGTLRLPDKGKAKTLVVHVHGLTGSPNEHFHYNGARYFTKRGLASFRFGLYFDAPGARQLQECGISTHAKDLNTVLKFFRKKYKKIFVIGHSLGAATVLSSDLSFLDGIILWDGTKSIRGPKRKDFVYSKKLDAYILDWRMQTIMSKKMYKEWAEFPLPKDATKNLTKPLKVIVAGVGRLIDAGKDYYRSAKGPKEFATIKGAGHTFNEDGTEEKLFAETYSFVKKYSK